MRAVIRHPAAVVLLVLLAVAVAVAVLFVVRPVVAPPIDAASRFGSFQTTTARQMASASSVTVSGQITCINSASPVGVWVDAETSADGWAKIAVPYVAGGQSKVAYSYVLNKGGRFKVNVGCGGTAAKWKLSLSSPFVSGNTNFKCNDIDPFLAAVAKRLFRVDLTQGVPYATCQRF